MSDDGALELGDIAPGEHPGQRKLKPGEHPWSPSKLDEWASHPGTDDDA